MYAVLKHIHRACWDLPVTNRRSVKCVSVTLVCCQRVRLQWMRNGNGTPTSHGGLGRLCQSSLSPNYHLRLQQPRHLSSSQRSPELRKWAALRKSILNGRHTCAGLTHSDRDLKDSITAVYYFIYLVMKRTCCTHRHIKVTLKEQK